MEKKTREKADPLHAVHISRGFLARGEKMCYTDKKERGVEDAADREL